jgi:hypothetical protein
MDKNQIVELIRSNSQLKYEDFKKQATEAGVPIELFDQAWLEVNSKKKKIIKLLIPIFVLLIICVFGYIPVKNYLLTRTISFNSGTKTFADCLEIGQISAKKWSKEYSLLSFGMANTKLVKATTTGKSKFCYVEFVDVKSGERLQVVISPDEIERSIVKYFIDTKIQYIPIPNIINSTDILEKAGIDYKNLSPDESKDNQVVLTDLRYTGNFESDRYKISDPYAWAMVIMDKNQEIISEMEYNAVTGERMDKFDFNAVNTKNTPKKPTIGTTTSLNIDKIDGTWADWLSKLHKDGDDYFEDYNSGIKTAQTCLNIGNVRASSWLKDYELVDLVLGEDGVDQDNIKNGRSYICRIRYQSATNDESLNLSFGMDRITYTIAKYVMPDSRFSLLSASPKEIIDTDKISEQLKNEGSTDISSLILLYDRNKQKYVWVINRIKGGQILKDATL